jgi:integrase
MAMRKTLTDVLVRGAKPPGTGRLELTDERCSGLAFRVTAGGVRTWCFRFRDPRSGKTTRATIGTYPDVSLARARERAEDLRREVADGRNPVARKRQERAEAPTKTFQALANRYLDEHARRFKRSADADERNLRLHVLPEWSDRPYDEIARRDVISLVEKLIAVGKPVLANRVQALVSSIYSFALDADLVDRNPAARLRKRGVETTRTRVLSDDELRMFWKRSVLPPVSKPVGLALRLCLSTGMRAGEVAGLARRELVFLEDPIRAAALIPGDRVKNGQACYVPFATLALDTIREAIRMAGDKNDHVFPSRTSDGPIDGHALAVAMSRLADVVPDGLPGAETWKASPPTPHDLRRTCATRLASLGVAREDVSAVLHHIRTDITGRVYDHYERAKEKRAALELWATSLRCILERGRPAEVITPDRQASTMPELIVEEAATNQRPRAE